MFKPIYDFIEKILPAKTIDYLPNEFDPTDQMNGTKLIDPEGVKWVAENGLLVFF